MFKWILIGLAALIAAAVGNWWYGQYRSESRLLAQPVYRVLEQHDRALYDGLLARYRLLLRGEESRERFVNYANAEISRSATNAMGRASRESVRAMVEDMVVTAKKLQAVPGDACFQFLYPNIAGTPDVATVIDADSQARTLQLMAEVIRSAAEDAAPPPDPDKVKDNLAGIVNAVYADYGADAQALAHAEDPRVDRAKVCTIAISLYERILKLPPADGSDLLRTMAPAG